MFWCLIIWVGLTQKNGCTCGKMASIVIWFVQLTSQNRMVHGLITHSCGGGVVDGIIGYAKNIVAERLRERIKLVDFRVRDKGILFH